MTNPGRMPPSLPGRCILPAAAGNLAGAKASAFFSRERFDDQRNDAGKDGSRYPLQHQQIGAHVSKLAIIRRQALGRLGGALVRCASLLQRPVQLGVHDSHGSTLRWLLEVDAGLTDEFHAGRNQRFFYGCGRGAHEGKPLLETDHGIDPDFGVFRHFGAGPFQGRSGSSCLHWRDHDYPEISAILAERPIVDFCYPWLYLNHGREKNNHLPIWQIKIWSDISHKAILFGTR